jgi:DNA repair exonuclease SbcCD ATPase subunit
MGLYDDIKRVVQVAENVIDLAEDFTTPPQPLQAENRELRTQIRQKDQCIQTLTLQVQQLQSQVNQKEQQLQSLTTEKEALQARIQELEKGQRLAVGQRSSTHERATSVDESQPPRGSVVFGGLRGVKRRLASAGVEQRVAALSQALQYGEAGLDLVRQALEDESEQVRAAAKALLPTS